ncbi:MAG: beta strand repeat-containing protein [Candidatus Rhabdochlamydia sp.]
MSQEGIIDIIGTHPEIPTEFVANVGSAVPIANILELLGEVVVAGTNPFRSIGSGNTITYQVQTSQALAASDVTKIGLSNFNSAHFSVDANGFVSLTGGGQAIDSFSTDVSGPISPNAAGNVAFTGSTNVFSDGSVANTMRLNLQGTNHALFIGRGANTASAQLSVGTNGQVLIAATGADPAFATLTSSDNSITFTTGVNSLSLQVSGGTTVGKTITGDSGGALSPTAGNWNLFGSGSITTIGSGSTLTTQLTGLTNHAVLVGAGTTTITKLAVGTNGQILIGATAADPAFATVGTNANMNTVVGANSLTLNPYNCAKWIVDPTANIGTHQTIQAAITAASSGDTIFVRPATYTENLTLKAGVDICSFICDALTPNVTIIGNSTFTAAGTVSISGIRLQTNGAAFLTVSGSAVSSVNLQNCYLNCTNATGIIFSTSGVGSRIRLLNCLGDLGTTGISYFTNTAAAFGSGFESLLIKGCKFTNTGNSTTANDTSASITLVQDSMIESPLTTSSGGALSIQHSNIACGNLNTTAVTTAGTTANTIFLSNLLSGSASAISVGSGTSVAVYESVISSSNTNAITGAGTVTHGGNTFLVSSNINTTTQIIVSGDSSSTFGSANSGGANVLTINNTSNTATSSAQLKVSVAGATADDPTVLMTTTTTNWIMGVDNSVTVPTADTFVISQGTALGTNNIMSVATSGEINFPLQSSFLAILTSSVNDQTGDSTTYTIVYNSEIYDQNNDFDGTSTYTAPITARLLFTASVLFGGLGVANTSMAFNCVTSNRTYALFSCNPGVCMNSGNQLQLNGSTIADMDAGDTATIAVFVTGGTKVVDIVSGGATSPRTTFGGNILC